MARTSIFAYPELRAPFFISVCFTIFGFVLTLVEASLRTGEPSGYIFILAGVLGSVITTALMTLANRIKTYEDRIRQLEERLQEHPSEVH